MNGAALDQFDTDTKRVLAIMDSRADASSVADRAATIARELNATLTLLQMWSCGWLEIGIPSSSICLPVTLEWAREASQAAAVEQVSAIRRAICDEHGVRTQCRRGRVWSTSIKEARRDAYDTIVMANRTGAGWLGSYLRLRGVRLVLVSGE
jgi:nucleotide-binding universal stress UspA family protein